MKITNKYCLICNKITPHTKEKFYEGAIRGLFAFGTLGMSELFDFNPTKYECLKHENNKNCKI